MTHIIVMTDEQFDKWEKNTPVAYRLKIQIDTATVVKMILKIFALKRG